MQAKGEEIDYGVEFEEALPTLSHMALVQLQEAGPIKWREEGERKVERGEKERERRENACVRGVVNSL